MQLPKFRRGKRNKNLKITLDKYKARITGLGKNEKIAHPVIYYRETVKNLQKKLFIAMKKYKEAMDQERELVAKKRNSRVR